MYGVADEIPIGIWYELLPQVDLTLNMLRQSNLSHNVSSHSHLTGPHGFNKIPFTPLECIVLIHNNPGKQLMWEPHSVNGFYVSTSRENYRCYTLQAKDTRSKSVSDIVFFKHKYITNMTVTPEDTVIQAEK